VCSSDLRRSRATETVSLVCALALCAVATALMVRSHRRKDAFGSLLALIVLLVAGIPASFYGALSA